MMRIVCGNQGSTNYGCIVLIFSPGLERSCRFCVYNVWNRQYRTVFAQQAAALPNANPLLAIPAEGRTHGLS